MSRGTIPGGSNGTGVRSPGPGTGGAVGAAGLAESGATRRLSIANGLADVTDRGASNSGTRGGQSIVGAGDTGATGGAGRELAAASLANWLKAGCASAFSGACAHSC